jgi:hypothetical protein
MDILIQDQGAAWYYWKLPERNVLTMLIVWLLYFGHQVSVWGIVKWRFNQIGRKVEQRNSHLFTYLILLINTGFIFIHLIQTQIWFDGLAQDTPIWTSQGSVILMLALILIIENPRRGLFLGLRVGKPFSRNVSGFLRRNHPYIFSWAIVYTFWFHPMASDPQLLSGFFYMFLLFSQMSLAFIRVHLDKRWIITLESFVAVHAVIVAIFNKEFFDSTDIWPMFFTGFAFMFVFTYLYAFKKKRIVYGLVTLLYLSFVIWLYIPNPIGLGRDMILLQRLEFVWVPTILYAVSAATATIIFLALKLRKN